MSPHAKDNVLQSAKRCYFTIYQSKKGKKRNSWLLRWLVRHKPWHQGWEREWDRDREQREIARGGSEDVPS